MILQSKCLTPHIFSFYHSVEWIFFFFLNSVWIMLSGNVKIEQLNACDILEAHSSPDWHALIQFLAMPWQHAMNVFRLYVSFALAALQPFVRFGWLLSWFFLLKFLYTLTNGIETIAISIQKSEFSMRLQWRRRWQRQRRRRWRLKWFIDYYFAPKKEKNVALCVHWLRDCKWTFWSMHIVSRGMECIFPSCECDKIRSINDSI